MTTIHKIKKIAVVGGGTSGWMTAAALSQHFKNTGVEITLVESSQLGTIGVGEATIPTLRRFYQKLGFTDLEIIKATNATCKLGIEFKDWHKKGSSFIHPFGIFGQGTKEVPFHHYWLKAKKNGDKTALSDYSLGVQLAKQNKFSFPQEKPESQLEIFDWALHFDASLFANVMRDYSIKNNVTLVDNKITSVKLNKHSGDIESLIFENNEKLSADLFIDCSGFKALLIEGALESGYEDWSEWLLCDSAIAVQSSASETPLSRTVSTALEAGWSWQIPLQNRTGNGHVYSSKYTTVEKAKALLLAGIEGDLLHEPRSFSFTPGRRKQAWKKNCIAVGLSSGFLEPLESTSIALVETAIDKILLTFKSAQYSQEDINRFNEVTIMEYERVRDFIILHYKANQRDDAPMWAYCRDMEIPKSLSEKINKFKNEGNITRLPWEIFGEDSWLAIYDGFELYPEKYNTRVDNMESDYLNKNLNYMKNRINQSVSQAESHVSFLTKHCDFNVKK
jgi:tryptophan halogenase